MRLMPFEVALSAFIRKPNVGVKVRQVDVNV